MICAGCRGKSHKKCKGSPWCMCQHEGARSAPPVHDGGVRHLWMVGKLDQLPRSVKELQRLRAQASCVPLVASAS